MPDSPLAPSPYAVLGLSAQASESELRRAYRRKLRETHPDTGGEAAHFDLVQRAWEQVGTPEARAGYDSGLRRTSAIADRTWAPPAPSSRAGSSRPSAQMHGRAGGWYRSRYLESLHEWVGVGVHIPDPYDLKLVRSAPREIRRLLASAVAEEDTAEVLTRLGIGFTVWNDVRTDAGKIDHVVLGPTGLWGILSEDWGGFVQPRRGEIVGAGLALDERPLHDLGARARDFERRAKVRFATLAIVVPDDASPQSVEAVGTIRGATTLLIQRPRLANLLRVRPPGLTVGGIDLFDVRTRVQSAARFS